MISSILIKPTMWFGILCLVSILILKILFGYRRPHKFPPGPRGLPVIGNTLDVAKLVKETKYYNDVLCRLADTYGPIVGLRLGFTEPLLVISGKEAVTEMLSRPEFDGRSDGFLFKFRCGGSRRGLLFTDGDVWHSQKRFSLKTLIQFGFGKYTTEQVIQQDAIKLTDIITNLTIDGAPANISTPITVAVLSNLWFILEGTKFDVGAETPELKEVILMLKAVVMSMNIMGGILTLFPFLRYIFPKLLGFSTFKRRHEHIDKFIMDMISKHKKKATGECTSFIDAYLKEIEVQEAKSPFTSFNETQLIYILKDLLTAGVDTTDNTIGFTLAYLVVHQSVQLKLHDEIDRVIGKDICPSLSDKRRLPYLSAVISEVWRMANVTGTSLIHRAMTDSTLLGFNVKKNYGLIANFKSLHMDKEHWGDPEVFRPERFIDEDGKFIDDPWLMPFGHGRRKCLGESVARNTAFIFLASLFQKFHFMLPENHPELCLTGVEGFVISPPKMDVIVTQRH